MDQLPWRDQHHTVQSNVSDFAQIFKAEEHEFSSCAIPPQRHFGGEYRTPMRQWQKASVPCLTSAGIVLPSASGYTDRHKRCQQTADSEHVRTREERSRQRSGQPQPVTAVVTSEGTAIWHDSCGKSNTDTSPTKSRSIMGGSVGPLKALDLNVDMDRTGMTTFSEYSAAELTQPYQLHLLGPAVTCGGVRNDASTGKWNNISTITECIIKEKDLIIEKQKLKRIQLEQQLRESEAQLKAVLLTHSMESSQRQAGDLALQEQEYEKSMRHASNLAAASSIAKVVLEKSQLESKLGAAESEICGLLARCSAESEAAHEREQQLIAKLAEKDSAIASLHRRVEDVSGRMAAKNKKLQSLRRYLADVPTAEDHRTALQTIKNLQEELNLTNEHIDDLQKKADQSHRMLKDQEAEMKHVMEREREACGLIADQERLLTEFHDRENIRRVSGKPDVIKLMADLAAMQQDHQALLQVVQQHELERQEHEALQAALRSESDSLAEALRSEADEHGRQVKALTATVWEVNQRKQDLMEELMSAKEKVAAAEKLLSSSSSERSLIMQCVEAIVCCTENLERLLAAAVATDRSATDKALLLNGPGSGGHSSSSAASSAMPASGLQQQQLNLPPLLLTHAGAGTVCAVDEAQHLQVQLSRLDTIRTTLNKLHRLMINKYAEEMALSSDAECITQ